MDIESQFFYQCVFAGLSGLVFFSLPGFWVSALLGADLRIHKQPAAVFSSTALGLSCFGVFALGFTWCLGLTLATLLASWLVFQLLAAAIYYRYVRHLPKQPLVDIAPLSAGLLLLACAVYGLLPVVNIYPALYQGGVFANPMLFDHNKMAIVSSIAREGLPALNPYYAPLGERIPLMYYYAWHFLAAAIKLLTGVPVWNAEVALLWITAVATVLLLVLLVIRFTRKLSAGWLVIGFALTSMLPAVFSLVFGGRGLRWVGYPDTHPFELLWLQLSWSPQHVYAAMSILLLLFLLARAVAFPGQRWIIAVCIGLVAAAAFSASVWVGGIGLLLVLPFILFALWRLRLDYTQMYLPLALALLVCVVFALPVLSAELSGPPTGKFPLEIKSYIATRLFNRNSPLKQLGHIAFFWIQFLPLNLGIAYILGLPAVLAYAPKHT
ncbi:MAG: hypothetical protein QX197_05175, partial [Methylococcaceae bacterium]